MDYQYTSQKSSKENINRKNYKKHWMLLHYAWLRLFGSILLLSGCQCLNIKGEVHKDVLLPCMVVYKDEFDYSVLVVNWQRQENDTLVHTFFHGASHLEYQDSHYRGRTQIFYESLPNGNASLLLRNLTKSDAGNYVCHVILQQSSGYLTKYVNLTVDDTHEANMEYSNYLLIILSVLIPVVVVVVILVVVLIVCKKYYLYVPGKGRIKDEEAEVLVLDPIKMFREYMKPKTNEHEDVFEWHLTIGDSFYTTFMPEKEWFVKPKTINAKELFTTANKHLRSKRMLLVGDVGTGKSCFCKWLEKAWVNERIPLYQCVIYLSGKKINWGKKTSIKKILEQKCTGLSNVDMSSDVLLILDELDNFVYDENNNQTIIGLDTSLQFNKLVASILNKKLLPETDVLFVSQRDFLNNLHQFCTSTFALHDFNDSEANNVYETSYKPDFVSMMFDLNACNKKEHELTSTYEVLVSFLQQNLNKMNGKSSVEKKTRQLAKESYQNLVKGEQSKKESTKQQENILNFFNCSLKSKYQRNVLRDMLAALFCVWQPKLEEHLKDFLNFWLFGAKKGQKAVPLLFPVVKEHYTKNCHFIRFFMRLLPYPDYESLRSNTSNLNDNLRKLLRDYFTSHKDHKENYKKLAVVQCVFELHDDDLTEKLYFSEQFSLINTPLNSLDIRAMVYCLQNRRLQKLDLRLCALTDKFVEQIRNIIKNTDYVLLSSNTLTCNTGYFFEQLLQEPQCQIKKLALGTNDLGPRGAQSLWRALEYNTSLESLYLYDNNIGDQGTTKMVEHLLKNNSLKELHLCLNDFGVKAIENVKILKAKKMNLKVVVTISEDLDLFDYTEKKVADLFNTWQNYNQDWLIKLLKTVQADLQKEDWNMDAGLTQERVNKLIKHITDVMEMIEKETQSNKMETN